MSNNLPIRLLFVCMGNICRSPAAECTMKALIAEHGLENHFECDSAGTIDYHTGKSPDPRMRKAGMERGLKITGKARPLVHRDFAEFDHILVMDGENLHDAHTLAKTDHEKRKIKRLLDYTSHHQGEDVPDPYYGGEDGFHLVLRLVEEACGGVLNTLRKTHPLA